MTVRGRRASGPLLCAALSGVLAACGGGFGSNPPPAADPTRHRYVALGDGVTAAPCTGRRRRRAMVVAVVLAMSTLLGCGHRDPVEPGAAYVALGDSISAGAGIPPTADAGCLRSRRDYPRLVQDQLDYSSFADVTCSGATTVNLLRPQLADGASNDPQLDAVGARTRLVTLTLGINDDQLAYGLLAACLATDNQPSTVCQRILDAPQQEFDRQLSRAADRVEESLTLIRHQAPKARIVLVGYPRYLPDSGTCPDRLPVVTAMLPRLRRAFATIDADWRRAAAAVGADYVDTYTMSRGHDVCSADPWVNGWKDAPGKAVSLHPFEAFHEAVANAVVDLLKK